MNEHLQPVFEILLPGLEREKIEYWVYGGVSRAAFVGRFIRHNDDVDIFVKEPDFEIAKSVLNDLCKRYEFKLRLRRPLEHLTKSECTSLDVIPAKAGIQSTRWFPGPPLSRG